MILSRIGGVDLDKFAQEMESGERVGGKGRWHTRILRSKQSGGLVHMVGHFVTFDDERQVSFTAVSYREGEVFLNATMIVGVDAMDVWDVSRGEVQERRNTIELFEALKENVGGFENAVLLYTSLLGVRETRNIVGDYVITHGDVIGGRTFPDGTVRGAYPIDIHDPKGGKRSLSSSKKGAFILCRTVRCVQKAWTE